MAASITLQDIVGIATLNPSKYNANNAEINAALQRGLSRHGMTESNNSLLGDIDANNQQIRNLRSPVLPSEAVTREFGDVEYGKVAKEATEAARDAAIVAQGLAEAARDAAQAAQAGSEAAKDFAEIAQLAAENAQLAAEAARDLALAYRDAAEGHKNAAQDAQTAAEAAQLAAEGARDAAQAAQTAAEAARDKAEEWAINPEDIPVETVPDRFSALHHAAKSAASAGAAATSETNAAGSAAAALISENNAGDSETAAGVSEANALASETKASKWADEDEDIPVETAPDKFSAKHWSAKAQASVGGVNVTANDTTPGPLNTKIIVTGDLTKNVTNPGGDERLELGVDVPNQLEPTLSNNWDTITEPGFYFNSSTGATGIPQGIADLLMLHQQTDQKRTQWATRPTGLVDNMRMWWRARFSDAASWSPWFEIRGAQNVGTDQFVDYIGGAIQLRVAAVGSAGFSMVSNESAHDMNFRTGGVNRLVLRHSDGAALATGQFISENASSAEHLCVSGSIVAPLFAANAVGFAGVGTNSNHVFEIRQNGFRRIHWSGTIAQIPINGTFQFGDPTSANGVSLTSNTSLGSFQMNIRRNSTSTANHIGFRNPNGGVGGITTTGSSTNYATSSDRRLKENIGEVEEAMDDSWDIVKSVPAREFNFKGQADRQVGWLADELQERIPEAVIGEKDGFKMCFDCAVDKDTRLPMAVAIEDYQMVDYSKMVPYLWGALEKAIEKIETLEAKVAALESK
jgi:hypothetical protein